MVAGDRLTQHDCGENHCHDRVHRGEDRCDGQLPGLDRDVPILRITGGTPPGAGLPPEFQGAKVDRVVEVPADLVK